MFLIEISYLTFVSAGLSVFYIFLKSFLPYILNAKTNPTNHNQIKTVALIAGLSVFIHTTSYLIPNIELSNRYIHTLGGGFMGFLICFLAVKHSGINIDKIRLITVSVLIVTTLGVFNEIAEFYLQNYIGFTSAPNVNDTWLDLISNMFGIIIGGAILSQFHNNISKRIAH